MSTILYIYQLSLQLGTLSDGGSCGTDFYICEFCNFSTNRLVTFSSHIAKCASKFPDCFTCNKCVFQTKDVSNFQEHCQNHLMTSNVLTCQFCPFTSATSSEMMRHSSVCQKRQPTNQNSTKTEKSSYDYDCRDCNFFCNSSEQFEKHMSARHCLVWDYSCFHCDYRTQSFELFSSHISKFHPEILTSDPADAKKKDPETNKSQLIDCLYCNFSSESQIEVHEHMKSCCNTGNKAGQKRTKPANSELHDDFIEHKTVDQKTWISKKKFICAECPFRHHSKEGITRHSRSHQTSLNCICSNCDYKCKSVIMISKHISDAHPDVPSTDWRLFRDGEEM